MPAISPTIGRRVLVFTSGTAGVNNPAVPFDCGIAYVWGDTCINVGGVNHAGQPVSFTSVLLHDRAQDENDRHGDNSTYAVWMPYQFEQAQRASAKKEGA